MKLLTKDECKSFQKKSYKQDGKGRKAKTFVAAATICMYRQDFSNLYIEVKKSQLNRNTIHFYSNVFDISVLVMNKIN